MVAAAVVVVEVVVYGLCTVHAVFANVMSLNLQLVKDN